jgi:hypothetical protein
MPVWDEQVARMAWKRAKLLKTRKPMKPKTGEVGAMVPVSTKSVCALCVRCVRPWFVTRIHTSKTSNFEIGSGWFPNYGKLRYFPGKLRLLPGKLCLSKA